LEYRYGFKAPSEPERWTIIENKCTPKTEYTNPPPAKVVKRKITVNNTRIHIKSIFTAQRQFDDALQSIVMRRMKEKRG
jgi:hypothetical protein